MLKTGIRSTAYFDVYDYREGLFKMKRHGYDCVDFNGLISPNSELYKMCGKELTNYFTELKTSAKNAGVELWQVHAMWPHDDTTKESREFVVSRHIMAIRAAGIMGSKYFVIHPAVPYGFGKEISRKEAYVITAERFLKLLPYAKDEGVILCVENMPFINGHSFSTIKEIKDIVSDINDSHMKICFDTGHCNVTGENHYEAVKMLGNDIVCLHVHDDLNRQDRHLIPFQGEIDWAGFTKALKEINFKGCMSLETCIKKTTPEPIKEKMQIVLSEIAQYLAQQV